MWPYSFAGSGYSRTGCWRLPLASGTNEDRVLTQMSSLRASATNTMQGELLTSHTYPIRLLQLPRAVHCVVGPGHSVHSVQETRVLQWPQEFVFQDGCVAVRKSRQAVPECHKGPPDLEAAVRLKCLLFLSLGDSRTSAYWDPGASPGDLSTCFRGHSVCICTKCVYIALPSTHARIALYLP